MERLLPIYFAVQYFQKPSYLYIHSPCTHVCVCVRARIPLLMCRNDSPLARLAGSFAPQGYFDYTWIPFIFGSIVAGLLMQPTLGSSCGLCQFPFCFEHFLVSTPGIQFGWPIHITCLGVSLIAVCFNSTRAVYFDIWPYLDNRCL